MGHLIIRLILFIVALSLSVLLSKDLWFYLFSIIKFEPHAKNAEVEFLCPFRTSINSLLYGNISICSKDRISDMQDTVQSILLFTSQFWNHSFRNVPVCHLSLSLHVFENPKSITAWERGGR
jgi:hypothetical protein